MRELALFAGAGGGILGGKLLGWRTVCAVEIDAYCQRVLLARQRDGMLPRFPIWDDVRTFDGHRWRGSVDVVSGGFPCQDISAAGNGAGITGERSGLWTEMARIIREVQPRFAFVENSPMLTSRGLGVVLGDLAELGYDARWGVFSAAGCGAPHLRRRIWIVANACGGRRGGAGEWQDQQPRRTEAVGASEAVADAAGIGRIEGRQSDAEEIARRWDVDRGSVCENEVADATGQRCGETRQYRSDESEERISGGGWTNEWWNVEPPLGRVAPRMANRVDQLRALGNGQVPAVARRAWLQLSASFPHPAPDTGA